MLLLILAINVMILADVGFDNRVFTMDLPVEVGGDAGTLTYDNEQYKVVLSEAVGHIGVQNAPKSIMLWGMLALLFFGVLVFAFSWIFRRFMVNVRNGSTFSTANMKALKHMAYLIASLWALRLVYYKILYYKLVGNLQFEHIKFNNDFDYQFMILIPALFLWVLSHIFTKGAELEQELKLTV
jgi:hypothetical protein